MLGAIVFDYGQNVTAKPEIPERLAVGSAQTVEGGKGDNASYRVVATRDRGDDEIVVVAVPLRDVDEILDRLVLDRGLRDRGRPAAARAPSRGSSCASGCCRSTGSATRRAGSPAATSPTASRAPTRAPRSAASGLALNAMLDRLERAFAERQASEDRLRQFIADASHELRTPLASIRGYAELYRMGAAREPDEVERSMRRIEDEAARMGVLVEDLLTLARLDEVVDAPHGEVDLAKLAGDAAGDARATAPDRAIEVTGDGTAIVLGDAHQLRQVLGNLLRNALVHTPAGSPIEVGVSAADAGGPARGARPRPRPARPTTPTRCSSASGAPRAGASAARAAPASASRSWPGSSTRTAAA